VNGTWDNARARPDGRHGLDELDWVSCATAGNCSAAGYYRDSSLSAMAAVIGEHNGKWGKLMPVRGLGPGAAGTTSEVNSVSCGATGDCTAGGYVSGNFHGGPQAWDSFLVTERNGTWGKAHPVTGIPHGTKVSPSEVLSVSCATAASCSAGGYYDLNSNGNAVAFVLSERNGKWGRGMVVPGQSLPVFYDAQVSWVSCPAAAQCTAAGDYFNRAVQEQVFVVGQR
jgi:hypothetical protein